MLILQFAGHLLNFLLLAAAFGVFTLSLVLLVECLLSLLPQQYKSSKGQAKTSSPRIAVLVPAHNEADGIGQTLHSILPQLSASDQVLVIADNCSDDTARIATTVGATVLERSNLTQRGKGYALHYGLQTIASAPPDVVIFVDADCQLGDLSIQRLAQQAADSRRPVQAKYLMKKPPGASQKEGISAFSVTVRNWVRPKGLARLNLPFLLTGSGMAFPWHVIQSVDLASGNIVEDMKLGLDLAIAGYPPTFCEAAEVLSQLPTQRQAENTQRTRWIHGHLQSIVTYVPRLMGAAITQRRPGLLALALDLAVLPLTLFILLWFLLVSVAVLSSIIGLSWLPLLILVVSGVLLLTAILISWKTYGFEDLSFAEILSIPGYILSRIPIFLKFVTRRESKWVRTDRS
jgi:cellulose synthase/poly-beta-1,6-N-acetylglucosamine synthase-like glycosyltransferase